MECRAGCGACCIAISISSAIPGMPDGKPAGVRCIHLDAMNKCALFNDPSRPVVCGQFKAGLDTCGESFEQAMEILEWLEIKTGA